MVSIVLPTYNRSKYIRESIDSIMAQTFHDWELIVIDDCSSDETYSIVKEYAKSDGRISILRNDKHIKLPASLNRGFAVAKGEYLTWTSDDNIYKPKALERLVQSFDREEIGLVFSAMDIINANGKIIGCSKKNKLEDLHFRNIIGGSFMYTRRAFQLVGEYDTNMLLVEDFDYWIRIARHFALKYVDESLYLYRIHEESLSETMRIQVLRAKVKLLKREICFIDKNNDSLLAKMYREVAYAAFDLQDYKLLHEYTLKIKSLSGCTVKLPLIILLSDMLGEKAMLCLSNVKRQVRAVLWKYRGLRT